MYQQEFMDRAVALAERGMQAGHGGPFGCVISKDNQIVGEGSNMVTSSNDPTAHAEVVAIRNACAQLKTYQLSDCDIYCSCEPCPMCLGAIYWARPRQVFYANTRQEAAAIEFDDEFIYNEINAAHALRKIPFIHKPNKKAQEIFDAWMNFGGRKEY